MAGSPGVIGPSGDVSPAGARGSNTLALISFLCAVAACAATLLFACTYLSGFIQLPLMNVGYWSATVLLAIMAVIAAGGIASIVTGILGLVRARRYSAQKAGTALAVTGLVLGILVTFVVGGLAVLDALAFVSCASSAAC